MFSRSLYFYVGRSTFVVCAAFTFAGCRGSGTVVGTCGVFPFVSFTLPEPLIDVLRVCLLDFKHSRRLNILISRANFSVWSDKSSSGVLVFGIALLLMRSGGFRVLRSLF